MRRIFVIVLVLLLPLRAWVGDAMAMQMALPGGTAHAAAAAQPQHGAVPHHHADTADDHRHDTPTAMAADCAEHTGVDTSGNDTHCQTCTMCQTCHTVAITAAPMDLPAAHGVRSLPPRATESFVSAEHARGLKPPIS